MGKRFKYLTSVHKSYTDQGLVFFLCQSYPRLEERQRQKIDNLCERAGGDYAAALKSFLCTQTPWQLVCMDHAISPATLERMRRRFYDLW